jgi:hypothetical protein
LLLGMVIQDSLERPKKGISFYVYMSRKVLDSVIVRLQNNCPPHQSSICCKNWSGG